MHLLQISRPRFYSYLFGPFLIGGAASFQNPTQFTDLFFLLFLLYFAFPANVFLYGVNDIYDTETDAANPKKRSHEHLLQDQEEWPLLLSVVSIAVLTVVCLLLVDTAAGIMLGTFLFLSWSYSAPPFRFKARPFLDAYSNVLYAFPGYFSYALFTGSFPTLGAIIMGLTWSAGMHAFSAIPDMTVDKKAGIATTAVFLGKQKTLLFILANWLVFSLLCLYYFGVLGILGWVPFVIALYIFRANKRTEDFYWYFPYIIPTLGFLAFWQIMISRFGWAALWSSAWQIL
jgi:4-hydroxybenzoate polyprenyltransferase